MVSHVVKNFLLRIDGNLDVSIERFAAQIVVPSSLLSLEPELNFFCYFALLDRLHKLPQVVNFHLQDFVFPFLHRYLSTKHRRVLQSAQLLHSGFLERGK